MDTDQRISDLEKALQVALSYLAQYEPPDSRTISDVFVAMAAVQAGHPIQNEACMPIIEETIDWMNNNQLPNLHHLVTSEVTVTFGDPPDGQTSNIQ